MDDIALIIGLGTQLANQCCIIAVRDEADVLAVGFRSNTQPQFARDLAHDALLHAA